MFEQVGQGPDHFWLFMSIIFVVIMGSLVSTYSSETITDVEAPIVTDAALPMDTDSGL